ncbi:aldose epimerase family protein [Peribacillus sp. NPDC097895]|uniref:aldose epimerase family protein n=1 Tax=Peribacillus sp. NPDC097895 TaxID=3390619 RepID=UPI003D073D4F
MRITSRKFGEINDQEIHAYTMTNKEIEITCMNYGCIISNIIMNDNGGKRESIVLGFDTLEEYIQHSPYFGAIVGRVAGRIKGAQFELDENVYRLAKNENKNHLHGGMEGFSHKIWKAEMIEGKSEVGVEFSYMSPDEEEGYPGNLHVKVTYTLNDRNEFQITYEGNGDQKTLLDLTNHTYFNLSGNAKRDILDHTLNVKSSRFLELDHELLPTGEFINVDHSSFDFREGRKIRDGVNSKNPQNLLVGQGYDHPFLLDHEAETNISLFDHESGRKVSIETDQPSVVVYSSNQLIGDFSIRGVHAQKYLGICLETQGLPDSIHHPHFPSTILQADETYQSTTKYTFEVY